MSLLVLAFRLLGVGREIHDLPSPKGLLGQSPSLNQSREEIGDLGIQPVLQLGNGHPRGCILDQSDDGFGERTEFGETDIVEMDQDVGCRP